VEERTLSASTGPMLDVPFDRFIFVGVREHNGTNPNSSDAGPYAMADIRDLVTDRLNFCLRVSVEHMVDLAAQIVAERDLVTLLRNSITDNWLTAN
jgi:hypothetical protein